MKTSIEKRIDPSLTLYEVLDAWRRNEFDKMQNCAKQIEQYLDDYDPADERTAPAPPDIDNDSWACICHILQNYARIAKAIKPIHL